MKLARSIWHGTDELVEPLPILYPYLDHHVKRFPNTDTRVTIFIYLLI